jgi:hypothetical protein
MLVIFVFFTPVQSFKSDPEWIQLLMDHYGFEWQEDDVDDFIFRLTDIASSPYPVRGLDSQKLAELMFLTEITISEILNWKDKSELLTLDNLAYSQILNYVELELLTYFVTFESSSAIDLDNTTSIKPKFRAPSFYTDFKFKTVKPTANGYKKYPPSYLGNKNRLEDKIWVSEPTYSMHISRSKLPGENFRYPIQIGFSTFHIRIVNPNLKNNHSKKFQIREVLIGDYQLRVGHGLIARNGTMRVGTESLSNLSGLLNTPIPYRSSVSGKFMRGIITQLKLSMVEVQLYYSKRSLSATPNDERTYFLPGWTSKRTTLSEVERFRNITLFTTGFTGNYQSHIYRYRVNITSTVMNHVFNQPIIKRAGYFNTYAIDRNNSLEHTSFISINSRIWAYSFEYANVNGKNSAFVQRLNINKNDVSIGLWHRNYSKGFRTLIGTGPAAMGGSNNEMGIGFWLKYKRSRIQQFQLFMDNYKSIIPRSNSMMPIYGWEQVVNYSRILGKTSNLELRVRRRSQLTGEIWSDRFEREYYNRAKSQNISIRATFRQRHGRNVFVHSKFDFNTKIDEVEGRQGSGFGISQLIRYSLSTFDLYVSHLVFNTLNFDHRIFNYEYDLIQSFSIPSFYGNGQRSYVMIHLEPIKQVIIRFKTGYTKYFDRTIIGSGNEQIDSNYRFDFGFQLRLNM